jgi:hypothetical protein
MDQPISDINIYCDQHHDNWYEYIYSPYYSNSPHNSKHMFDIYTLGHVFWQMLFMWIGKKILPSHKKEVASILFIISSLFEFYENQPEQIIKYRRIEITSSGKTSYRGDSIINSFGDIIGNCIGIYLGYILEEDSMIIFILIMFFFVITINIELVYWTDLIQFSLDS